MGDYNTVNDNRSGRSRPSSQESSPILDSGESPFTKGKRVNTTLDNLSRDNNEETVSEKRDHRSQQPKSGSYPIWSKLQVLRNMFLVICIGVRQWQYGVLMASQSKEKDIVCNKKRSYTDTIFMEALEWLEKSRVLMINFLACSASRILKRTLLVNSDLCVATENRYC